MMPYCSRYEYLHLARKLHMQHRDALKSLHTGDAFTFKRQLLFMRWYANTVFIMNTRDPYRMLQRRGVCVCVCVCMCVCVCAEASVRLCADTLSVKEE